MDFDEWKCLYSWGSSWQLVSIVSGDGLAPNRNQVISHYGDVIMGAIASQIASLIIVYSTVYSHADQRKHQSSASLAFVWGIHLGPVNFPHKWPVTRKMFPFDDVIMSWIKDDPGHRCIHQTSLRLTNLNAHVNFQGSLLLREIALY